MSYNERNPTLSFRIERAELKHLEKLAEKDKITKSKIKTILFERRYPAATLADIIYEKHRK